jgi:hypothetical protein
MAESAFSVDPTGMPKKITITTSTGFSWLTLQLPSLEKIISTTQQGWMMMMISHMVQVPSQYVAIMAGVTALTRLRNLLSTRWESNLQETRIR